MWFVNDTGYIEAEKVTMVWSCDEGNGGKINVEISEGNGSTGKEGKENLERYSVEAFCLFINNNLQRYIVVYGTKAKSTHRC